MERGETLMLLNTLNEEQRIRVAELLELLVVDTNGDNDSTAFRIPDTHPNKPSSDNAKTTPM